jgi:hypothetical protein
MPYLSPEIIREKNGSFLMGCFLVIGKVKRDWQFLNREPIRRAFEANEEQIQFVFRAIPHPNPSMVMVFRKRDSMDDRRSKGFSPTINERHFISP